jgi:hypothetical protein
VGTFLAPDALINTRCEVFHSRCTSTVHIFIYSYSTTCLASAPDRPPIPSPLIPTPQPAYADPYKCRKPRIECTEVCPVLLPTSRQGSGRHCATMQMRNRLQWLWVYATHRVGKFILNFWRLRNGRCHLFLLPLGTARRCRLSPCPGCITSIRMLVYYDLCGLPLPAE